MKFELLIEEFVNNLIFLSETMEFDEIIEVDAARHVLTGLINW